MSLMQRIHGWSQRRLPAPLVRAVVRSGLTNRLRRWNPRRDPTYAWPLNGALAGHRMRVRNPEEYQYVEAPYEPQIADVVQRLAKPGSVCVDAEAHIGFFSLLLAKLVGPGGRIFSFEANPDNARQLKENIALNGYADRVTTENLAVSDGVQTRLRLRRGPSSFEGSVARRLESQQDDEGSFEVGATSLDGYFSPRQRLDLIKMDIEGAEVWAMAGMGGILARQRPVILLELHAGCDLCLQTLLQAGYALHDLNMVPIDANSPPRYIVAMPGAQDPASR